MEVIQLKALTRSLSDDKDIADVYSHFEEQLQRVSRENDSLHKQLSRLKLKALTSLESGRALNTSVVSGVSLGAGLGAKTILSKQLSQNDSLRREVEELRRKERLQTVAVKLSEDLSKRLKAAHAKHSKLSGDHEALRQAHAALEQDAAALRSDNEYLRKAYGELRVERARNLEELHLLRSAAREHDVERRRWNKLDKFAAKHGNTSTSTARDR